MDNKLEDIFDSLTEEETAELLSGFKPERICRGSTKRIRERTVALAGKEPQSRTSGRIPRRRVWLAAAVTALIAALAAGSAAYAADAKEYKAAMEFFNEYELDPEGLTRGEIKAVYRDISTESFTYSKSAEILSHSIIANHLPGYELTVRNNGSFPGNAKDIWQLLIREEAEVGEGRGTWFKHELNYRFHDEGGGWYEEIGSFVEKYDGTELLWHTDLDPLEVWDQIEYSGGVILIAAVYDASLTRTNWLVRLDENGKVLWKNTFGDSNEYVCTLLANEDGSIAVFSRQERSSFCFTKLDADGRVIHRSAPDQSVSAGIGKAAHYKDGYLVQLWSYTDTQLTSFAKVDKDGNIMEICSVPPTEDRIYYLKDLICYGGRIYLSVYSIPNDLGEPDPDDIVFYGSHDEIRPILETCFDYGSKGITDIPGLTEMVKERYEADLMILEPEEGKLSECYYVKGGLGGDLSVSSDGKLVWGVESIAGTFFSLATNSFTIGGVSRINEYRFAQDGSFIDMLETNEFVNFAR